jgi:murein DD-endopeptidase MepM/ murein hydrolase activator NlpD
VAQSLIVLFVAATATGVPRSTAADQSCSTVQDCNNQINQAKQGADAKQRQIDQLAAKIAAAKDNEAQLAAIIRGLDALVAQTQTQLAAAQATLAQTTQELADAQLVLAEARAVLAAKKQQLALELVIMYELQIQSTPLNDLINGGNFNDFFTAVLNSRRISAKERQTVDEVHHQQDVVQADVDTITTRRLQQQAARDQVNARLADLSAQRTAQQSAYAAYAAAQAKYEQEEQAAMAAQAQLNAAVARLINQRNALAQGKFVWPDPGPISQGFGCTVYSFEPYDASCPWPHRFHNGLDIAGPCWTNVVAADGGIAYPQPFMSYGYGNWILVNHGNGFVTLYGHLAAYAVGYGQAVGRGQLIGHEGSTGNSTGCHVHFGVSRNGQWVNPLAYLPAR